MTVSVFGGEGEDLAEQTQIAVSRRIGDGL